MWAALACLGAGAVSCDKLPLLAPSQSTITLSTNSSIVQSNGTAEIRATVLESGGTPVQNGTTVSFTTNLGVLSPTEARTVNGVATVQFVANGNSGIAEIQAVSGGAKPADTANPALKLTVGAAATGRIVVSASPTTVASTGGTAAIVANVVDTAGNPLPNVAVSFSTTAGSLSSGIAMTDSNGNAQITLTTNREATVTANAGGAGSTGTTTSGSVVVRVNAAGSVGVSASPSPAVVGQQVSVSVTLTPGGSPVQRVVLDFGDGTSTTLGATSTTVPHTYTRSGTFTIRATAYDTLGDSSTNTASLVVTAAPRPTVSISGSTTAGVTTFTVVVTAATGSTIDGVTISYGDGQSDSLGAASGTLSIQHLYQAAGTYTATARAEDTSGSEASASTVIFVPASVTLNVSTSNRTANFTANVSPPATTISSYFWNFGDGTQTTTTNQADRTYSSSGSKTATVTITLPNGQTATDDVTFTLP